MNSLKNLIQILSSQERRKGCGLLFGMIISTVLEIIGNGLVAPLIALMSKPSLIENNFYIKKILDSLGNPNQRQLIMGSVLLLIAFHFLKTLFMTYVVWTQKKFAYNVLANLSDKLFDCYLKQPWTFHLERNSAQLIQHVLNETTIFITNALLPGMSLISEILVLLGISIFLFILQPLGTAIIVLSVLCISVMYHFYIRSYISNWGNARQYHVGLCFQYVQEGLGGVKDAMLLGRKTEFLEQFKHHNSLTAKYNQRQQTFLDLPRIWLELLAVIGMGILVAVMIEKGGSIDTLVPSLGLFAAAAFRIMPSINRILGAIQGLHYGLPVINTLKEELFLLDKSPIHSSSTIEIPFTYEIQLKNICYRYEKAARTLNNINIRIARGSSIGLIGASGAGKSTLVDIILGLLTPESGLVTVDEKNIHINLRSWQDKIGYVPQSIFLTDDTLRRNVAFGVPEALIDNSAVLRAIKAARLEDFIKTLPEGLETAVGERGLRISGGQRQRIGIARALYHDPDILVLDEATSSLDLLTEKEVMEAVNALHGNKTLIIVAHRLSTVSQCDYLYKLDHGEIIAEGIFEEVTDSNQATRVKNKINEMQFEG